MRLNKVLEQAILAIQGNHSLVMDAEFYGRVEAEVERRVQAGVRAAMARRDAENVEHYAKHAGLYIEKEKRGAVLEALKEERKRISRLLPDPRTMSGWNDPSAPEDVLNDLRDICEIKGIEPPGHIRALSAKLSSGEVVLKGGGE